MTSCHGPACHARSPYRSRRRLCGELELARTTAAPRPRPARERLDDGRLGRRHADADVRDVVRAGSAAGRGRPSRLPPRGPARQATSASRSASTEQRAVDERRPPAAVGGDACHLAAADAHGALVDASRRRRARGTRRRCRSEAGRTGRARRAPRRDGPPGRRRPMHRVPGSRWTAPPPVNRRHTRRLARRRQPASISQSARWKRPITTAGRVCQRMRTGSAGSARTTASSSASASAGSQQPGCDDPHRGRQRTRTPARASRVAAEAGADASSATSSGSRGAGRVERRRSSAGSPSRSSSARASATRPAAADRLLRSVAGRLGRETGERQRLAAGGLGPGIVAARRELDVERRRLDAPRPSPGARGRSAPAGAESRGGRTRLAGGRPRRPRRTGPGRPRPPRRPAPARRRAAMP